MKISRRKIFAFFSFGFWIFSGLLLFPEYGSAEVETPLPSLLITEIAAFEGNGYEWIEIFNPGQQEIDLAGIIFFEDSTNHRLSSFPSSSPTLLTPGGYAVIAQDAEKFLQKYASFQGILLDSSWGSLKESGEEIGLKDQQENIIELFTYLPAENFSLKRKTNSLNYQAENWIEENESSPGEKNFAGESAANTQNEPPLEISPVPTPSPETPLQSPVAPPPQIDTPSSSPAPQSTLSQPSPEISEPISIPPKIFITEVNFNDPSQDWVEIFVEDDGNNGQGRDFGGYSLFDTTKKKFEFPAGTFLRSSQYSLIPIPEGLSGGTQVLILKNPEGQGISALCWNDTSPSEQGIKAIKNLFEQNLWLSNDPSTCPRSDELEKRWSLALYDGQWNIFKHPTPGSQNIFQNQKPKAIITVQSGKTAGEAPLSINVTGESSWDPDGDRLRFLWDFGDGTQDDSANPSSHAYESSESYRLSLTVEDPYGDYDIASLEINVLEKGGKSNQKNQQEENRSQEIQKKNERKTPAETSDAKDFKKITESMKNIEKKMGALEKAVKKQNQNIKQMDKNLRRLFLASAKKLLTLFSKTLTSSEKTQTAKASPKPSSPKKQTAQKTPFSEENSLVVSDLSSKIVINEIYPSPSAETDPEEWIELFSAEDQEIRLAGWSLDDAEGGSKPYRFTDETIPAHGYLIIPKSISRLALNNTTDEVRLFNGESQLVQNVPYENPPAGNSYSRMVEGTYEWVQETTKNAPNPQYQTITGVVRGYDPQTRKALVENIKGVKYDLAIRNEELASVLTPLGFTEGAEATVRVKQNGAGDYELQEIQNLVPPVKKGLKNSWLLIVVAVSVLMILWQMAWTLKKHFPEIKRSLGKILQ